MKPSYANTLVSDYQKLIQRIAELLDQPPTSASCHIMALKRVLRTCLPSQWAIGSGYIQLPDNGPSIAASILVFDAQIPVLFREQDWVVVPAEGVHSVITYAVGNIQAAHAEALTRLQKNTDLSVAFAGIWAPKVDELYPSDVALSVATAAGYNGQAHVTSPLASLLGDWLQAFGPKEEASASDEQPQVEPELPVREATEKPLVPPSPTPEVTSKVAVAELAPKVLNRKAAGEQDKQTAEIVIPRKKPITRKKINQRPEATTQAAEALADAEPAPAVIHEAKDKAFQIPQKASKRKAKQVKAKVSGADPKTGNFPLHTAVLKRDYQQVSSLLQEGAVLEDKNKEGNTALHLATSQGLTDIVRLLLVSGADPNARNYVYAAPLHVAVEADHQEVIDLLLEHEAEVEARNNRGKTPLHIAAIHGRVEAVKLLLDGYADIHAHMEKDMQPLHLAAWYGQGEIVQLLIEKGADVDSINVDGNTALHFAAFKGQVKVIKTLINHQANMHIQNHSGLTYLQGINEGYSGEMIRVLE